MFYGPEDKIGIDARDDGRIANNVV